MGKRIAIFGATSAIAAATAQIWAAEHHSLYLVGRHEGRLKSVERDLVVRGAERVVSAVFDSAQIERHPLLVEEIEREFGPLDIVLVAFGSLGNQRSGEQDVNQALHEIRVNFLAPFSLLSHFASRFEARGRGTLAVIGSVAGDRGRASNYIYGSAKGALERFTQGLRNRLARRGVEVCLIKPGFVDTPMTAGFTKGPLWAHPAQIGAGIVRAIEHKREVVYLPWFWRPIMLILRHIPERLFKRMSL